MTRKPVVFLLVAAALAVLLQNVIFFRSAESPPDETIDLDGGEPDDDRVETIAPLDAAYVSDFLLHLPGTQRARSPFLTLLEAESLRPRSADRTHAVGGGRAPRLDGILWSPHHRVAWIDGRPRSEGDVVRGQRVEHIAPRAVTLRAGESQMHLLLRTAPARVGRSPQSAQPRPEVEQHDE